MSRFLKEDRRSEMTVCSVRICERTAHPNGGTVVQEICENPNGGAGNL